MTGVSECSQQRGNLKDNGYKSDFRLMISYWALPAKALSTTKRTVS
ncbi:hypothetical protein [Photorhabdus sp. RW14-46]|nr:hypothetical protein [Photorhabdus sp. RW14-46]